MTTKKERAEALARMTKAELVKTVMTLDGRLVKLLNRIAALEKDNELLTTYPVGSVKLDVKRANARASVGRMPWETALAATTDYAASSGAPIKRGE